MQNKRLGIVAAGLVGALALTACGGSSNKATTTTGTSKGTDTSKATGHVVFWDTMNQTGEGETMTALIQQFQSSHPGITVDHQFVSFDQARDKFKTAAQAGNAPDVMRSEVAWTAEFASLGYLHPLDKDVSQADLSDFLAGPLGTDQLGGHLWGLPQVTDAPALLYNKALLQKAGITNPPTTMDELKADAIKVSQTEKGVTGLYLNEGSYFVLPFVYAFGGDMLDANAKQIKIDKPEAVQGVQFAVDLFKTGGTEKPEDPSNNYNNMQTAFKTGKAAMVINGPWSLSDDLSGPAFKDPTNLGVAPTPAGPGGQSGAPVGGHNYTISANTKNYAASLALIQWLDQPAQQAQFAVKNGLLPTRKATYALSDVQSNTAISAFQPVMEKAKTRPVIPQGGQLFDAFDKAYQGAIQSGGSAQAAMKKVADAWKAFLTDYSD